MNTRGRYCTASQRPNTYAAHGCEQMVTSATFCMLLKHNKHWSTKCIVQLYYWMVDLGIHLGGCNWQAHHLGYAVAHIVIAFEGIFNEHLSMRFPLAHVQASEQTSCLQISWHACTWLLLCRQRTARDTLRAVLHMCLRKLTGYAYNPTDGVQSLRN